VVALGLTTIDLMQRVGRLPGPDENVQSTGARLDVGGPAANAALAARAVGSAARLVTGIGGGTMAALALERLAAGGVEVVDLAPRDYAPPVSSVLITEETGTRAVVSSNAAELTSPAPLPANVLEGATCLLVDGHIMGRAIEAAALARRRGIPVMMDGGSWKPGTAQLLGNVDVAILSADFTPPAPRGTVPLDWVAGLGPRWNAVSHGPSPVELRLSDGVTHLLPVPHVPHVVDTLGAGDALHGAAAAALAWDPASGRAPLRAGLSDESVRAALVEGIKAARRSVGSAGALRP
jgi:sugar/nucleoside kinase (ribokinase family)